MAMAAAGGPPIARVRTQGFSGYNVAWSPFFENRLAVAGAANYGLVGNGRVHVLSAELGPGPSAGLTVEKGYDTQDGLYDVAWSEVHENQLVTASGDGSIKLWDIGLNDHPIRNWHEHGREVFCVDWNNLKKELFASSSWDASVRIWHPERPTALAAITAHTACVYGCAWSPHDGDLIASASGDGCVRLFDLRTGGGAAPGIAGGPTPGVQHQPVATIPVGGEVLSLDWNKYRPMRIATGSTDRAVKVWDMRFVGAGKTPGVAGGEAMTSAVLLGHEYAVRKVAWSPHAANLVCSASYDMTARIWDVDAAQQQHNTGAGGIGMDAGPALRKMHDTHTEFVVGAAWALFQEGLVATCAWDCETHLWSALG
ncbi:WD40 repeat-like protein [Tilletiaria anomala UBC 951]|uniref:Peroxin-7 n=1 Tax=Tilletiaria anomala (strain ATCC 24038 / CBS 436.72 / UBC 951) TaxID=1037660 RepID=A0A066V553_TILAU|nr:WD40 repeat-like protein [Tilletiaria anomala UBC 951]KDN36837.1 WD40 repeat-like protein [Tilletiaria anomala UBC 951]